MPWFVSPIKNIAFSYSIVSCNSSLGSNEGKIDFSEQIQPRNFRILCFVNLYNIKRQWQKKKEWLVWVNKTLSRNPFKSWSRVTSKSVLEHSQHISHMQALERTRLGLSPSFRWKWTSSRRNKAIFNPTPNTSQPPMICPVNGLWVYSTLGSPQHGHK